MKKKYVATVMRRHYVGDGVFIFNCDHAIIGEIDEKSGIMKDRNGNEFLSMMNPNLMSSEIPYAYSNVHELSSLSKKLGENLSTAEAISLYEFLCKQAFFVVGKSENGKTYYTVFNIEEWKDRINSLNEENLESSENNYSSKDTNSGKDEDIDEDEDMDEQLKTIITNVVNGKYSLKELKKIRDSLKVNIEDLEQAVDTIELQIDATENGESFLKLPDDSGDEVSIEEKQKQEEEDIFDEKESQNINPVIAGGIDIKDLFNKVTRTLIAQDEPARRVITEIARKEIDERKKKEGILLTGSTGVGKTELMRLIAKYLNRPFYKIDATQLTIPGYTGLNIEEVLWDLYVKCEQDIDKTQNAIIFFDEIDKKGSGNKADVGGQGVLNVLLPFIEGTEYRAQSSMKKVCPVVSIDTSHMIVILGGAYMDVYKNMLEKNGVGFNQNVSSTPKYRKPTTKDFVEKGMMTDEFMGRVTVIKLNDLDVEAIKRVMLESDESALKVQQEIFDKLGVRLTFTDGFTSYVAEEAVKKKTGARGLNGIIDEATWEAFEEVYSNQGKYQEVIIDENTAKDSSKYQLVKKK